MMAELSGLPPGEALERAHEAFITSASAKRDTGSWGHTRSE